MGLRALVVPALEEFSYVFPANDPTGDMISLIRRSSCQVKTFRYDHIDQPQDLVRLLGAMPSLEEITLGIESLEDVMLLDEFLERLSDPPPIDPTDDDHKVFSSPSAVLVFRGVSIILLQPFI